MGCEFTPYVPFVLLSAVLLGWRYAAVVALAIAVIADVLFIAPRNQFLGGVGDIFGVGVFLTTSSVIIGFVEILRHLIEGTYWPARSQDHQRGIIFSQDGSDALVSWRGSGPPLRLGSYDEVAGMMVDFLAQREFGKRLTDGAFGATTAPFPRDPDDLLLSLCAVQPEGTLFDFDQLCRERWGKAALPVLHFQLRELADRNEVVIWAGSAGTLTVVTRSSRECASAIR
jgi:hypothetical protein